MINEHPFSDTEEGEETPYNIEIVKSFEKLTMTNDTKEDNQPKTLKVADSLDVVKVQEENDILLANDEEDNYDSDDDGFEDENDRYDYEIVNNRHRYKRQEAGRIRVRKTELVMDHRTRKILFKLLSRGIINEINDCIFTGKEANIYQGVSKADGEYAIKIYKASVVVFKDRAKYISGEFRQNTYIPQRLEQVRHIELDTDKAKKGKKSNIIFDNIIDLNSDKKVRQQPDMLKGKKKTRYHGNKNNVDNENNNDNDAYDDKENNVSKPGRRPRNESPESRKLRKKAVKAAQAEKRKMKVKKHIKKRKQRGIKKN